MRVQVGAAGGRVGADLAVERLVAWQHLAPGADRDVGLLATDRDVRVGRVGDAQEQVVELRLGLGQLASSALIRSPAATEAALQVGDLRAVRRGPALDRLADPLPGGVAFRLECLALAEQPAPLGVELQGAIDERRILALLDGALADDVRFVAQPLEADAHEPPPAGPRSPPPPRAAARGRMPVRDWPGATRRAARSGRPRNAR